MLIEFFAEVWSAATDFILAAFPWVVFWKLQMKPVEKIGICICMSMGFLYDFSTVPLPFLVMYLQKFS